MQLFILLYIEAGSYIQEDEETWEFVVLYVVSSKSIYHQSVNKQLFPRTGMSVDEDATGRLCIISRDIQHCTHSTVSLK